MLKRLTTHHVSLPVPGGVPVETSLHSIASAECAVVEIQSDDHVGIGYAMTFSEQQTAAIRLVIEDLATSLVGAQAEPRRLRARMLDLLDYSGRTGIGLAAVCALDTALWDLLAKSAGLPLRSLLGGGRSTLPVYVSCGFLSQHPEEIAEQISSWSRNGLSRFKIKVGHEDWRVDVERLTVIRELSPSGSIFMADANQAWTVKEAIAAGRALGAEGLSWLEDPLRSGDLLGLARVSEALDVVVVSGESAYLTQDFAAILHRRACDVLMPDVMRCGGPSGVLDIATLADAHQTKVASHAFTEIYAPFFATLPNALVLEHFPGWFEQLYETPFDITAGAMNLSAAPGLGLSLSREALMRFAASPQRHVELTGTRSRYSVDRIEGTTR